MARVRNTDVIDAPAQEVFDYLSRLEHLDEWDVVVKSSRSIEEGSPRLGSRYLFEVHAMGMKGEVEGRITAYEPSRRLAFELDRFGPLRPRAEIILTPTDGGTRVEHWFDPHPVPAFKVFLPMMLLYAKWTAGKGVDRLKSRLEGARGGGEVSPRA